METLIASAQEIYEEHTCALIGAVLVVCALVIIGVAYYMGWIGKASASGPLDNEEEFNGLIASIHAKQKPRKK